MAKHMVTCVQCGRRFDANWGGYYNSSSRRYTCRSCGKKMKQDQNYLRTGMRQSKAAMIIKIILGILFVLAGFQSPESGWSVGYFMTALVIGGALIAWGLVPYLKAKKSKVEEETSE